MGVMDDRRPARLINVQAFVNFHSTDELAISPAPTLDRPRIKSYHYSYHDFFIHVNVVVV